MAQDVALQRIPDIRPRRTLACDQPATGDRGGVRFFMCAPFFTSNGQRRASAWRTEEALNEES